MCANAIKSTDVKCNRGRSRCGWRIWQIKCAWRCVGNGIKWSAPASSWLKNRCMPKHNLAAGVSSTTGQFVTIWSVDNHSRYEDERVLNRKGWVLTGTIPRSPSMPAGERQSLAVGARLVWTMLSFLMTRRPTNPKFSYMWRRLLTDHIFVESVFEWI